MEDLSRSHNVNTLEEIKRTNPHLFWGVVTFLDPLVDLDSPRRVASCTSAIVQQYDTLKTVLRIG